MRAMKDMPAEEDDIAGFGVDRRLAVVAQGDLRQGVFLNIGMACGLY